MFFWVRQNTSTSTEMVANGVVLPGKFRLAVRRDALARQDNVLALPRPNAVSLNASGLIESGAFRASSTPGSRLDELFVFDNTSVAKNKSASATYYYWNGAWRKVGAGTTDVGTDAAFQPGTGVILRTGVAATSTFWTTQAAY